MEVRARIVIFSHLNTLQSNHLSAEERWRLSEFIKHITVQCPNVEDEIDPDQMYAEFLELPRVQMALEMFKEEAA